MNKAYENNEDDYMQIKIKIPETDMEFKTKIRIIKSIEDWDIISWFKEFESISVQNAWTNNQTLLILRNLIPDDRLDNENFSTDCITTMKNIIKTLHGKNIKENTMQYI